MTSKCPKCGAEIPDTATFCADCGTKLISSQDVSVTKTMETPLRDLTRGITFANRYEIIEELGQGGMGRMYRAYDKQIKEELAFKFLNPEISKDKKSLERFSSEIRLARKITDLGI